MCIYNVTLYQIRKQHPKSLTVSIFTGQTFLLIHRGFLHKKFFEIFLISPWVFGIFTGIYQVEENVRDINFLLHACVRWAGSRHCTHTVAGNGSDQAAARCNAKE